MSYVSSISLSSTPLSPPNPTPISLTRAPWEARWSSTGGVGSHVPSTTAMAQPPTIPKHQPPISSPSLGRRGVSNADPWGLVPREAARGRRARARAEGHHRHREKRKLSGVPCCYGYGYGMPLQMAEEDATLSLPAHKFAGAPPLPGLLRFGISAGAGFLPGKVMYYATLHACAIYVLDHGEERMKMELANIILTKHSDEKSLVEGVKRHFVAEHLFSDQHQDKPLFRWRQRHSYVDSNFVERVKEIEANNSEDEAISISGQTTAYARSFGDLMEDPLACILGSPDNNIESNKPPEHTATILNRRDLRARRRSHRHHHRHADKFAAL